MSVSYFCSVCVSVCIVYEVGSEVHIDFWF